MPVLELEFEVYCSCGNGLCRQTTEGQTVGRGMSYITVAPCEKCLAKGRDEGRDEGFSEGYDQGCFDTEGGHDIGL